ncbi:uncharacterized protein LOC124252930 isoform X1 [Haliotis rubra]|uniref:uncharacterized protein LOC124252930 isoform X1 n=1 Tax=Haliotis rubra TaxID=36100 RepID=UPI001EE5244A|nr:uncharacterized protein LOC124252930 isoform X1 [Haliotis rubra]
MSESEDSAQTFDVACAKGPGNQCGRSPTSHSQEAETDSLPTVRYCFTQRGISDDAAKFLVKSWRKGTRKQYACYLTRWKKFCSQRKVDFSLPSLADVLDFLLSLVKAGLSYSSVHTARCALSTIVLLNDQPCGSHPMVSRFLKAVFQENPPVPKYLEVWSVKDVLTFLQSLQTMFISLKELTIKLVLLVSLTTAQRGQTLHLLSLNNMTEKKSDITFHFADLVKQSKPGRLTKPLVLKEYSVDRRVCVVTVLREYIRRTADLRGSEKKLLITYIKPYKAVSRDTVSRWIRTGLAQAGIDTNVFAAHSTRAAATSAARQASVPIRTILDKADWSSEHTFASFYDKTIVARDNCFAEAILQ